MAKHLISLTEPFVYLGLLTFLFFDLTVHYWVQAIVKTRTSYVILVLLLWSLLSVLIDKGRDTCLTNRRTFPVAVSIACFAAWGLVMFLTDSGGYAERLNIYTSAVAGCIIAVAGILRPKKFFNMHILTGMYTFTIILAIYALFFYRSYLDLMNIEARFVPYSIPGEVDKNSFAYMLLFGFLQGIYMLHQIKGDALKRLIYLSQIFLVVLLFNAGSRQVLIMMFVCAAHLSEKQYPLSSAVPQNPCEALPFPFNGHPSCFRVGPVFREYETTLLPFRFCIERGGRVR